MYPCRERKQHQISLNNKIIAQEISEQFSYTKEKSKKNKKVTTLFSYGDESCAITFSNARNQVCHFPITCLVASTKLRLSLFDRIYIHRKNWNVTALDAAIMRNSKDTLVIYNWKAWSQSDNILVTAWSQSDHSMTTAWSQPDRSMTTAWSQPDHSMITAWSQPDHSLITAWSQPDDSLVIDWSLTDHYLITAWSLPKNSLIKQWFQPDHKPAITAWSQPDHSLIRARSQPDHSLITAWS